MTVNQISRLCLKKRENEIKDFLLLFQVKAVDVFPRILFSFESSFFKKATAAFQTEKDLRTSSILTHLVNGTPMKYYELKYPDIEVF